MAPDAPRPAIVVRAATSADASRIAEIYNHGIRDRIATFETRERGPDEVREWLGHPRYPCVVIESDVCVVGWAAASLYR